MFVQFGVFRCVLLWNSRLLSCQPSSVFFYSLWSWCVRSSYQSVLTDVFTGGNFLSRTTSWLIRRRAFDLVSLYSLVFMGCRSSSFAKCSLDEESFARFSWGGWVISCVWCDSSDVTSCVVWGEEDAAQTHLTTTPTQRRVCELHPKLEKTQTSTHREREVESKTDPDWNQKAAPLFFYVYMIMCAVFLSWNLHTVLTADHRRERQIHCF